MCLIAFSYKTHPDYDLIFAANRDEFYQRPTRPAQFWEDHAHLLAGKDLKAGGTWMGITKHGYFSALTNYRNPSLKKENPPSRGHLVLDYLIKENNPGSYFETIQPEAQNYNGFNLLAGSLHDLGYFSNQKKGYQILEPGIYGLSNHLLDTPWPKVTKTKAALTSITQQSEIEEEALFDLLTYDRPANDAELPNTGIPKDIERAVSAPFIKMDEYGTRSSAILLVDKSGRVIFEERRFKKGTQDIEEQNRFEFKIEHR